MTCSLCSAAATTSSVLHPILPVEPRTAIFREATGIEPQSDNEREPVPGERRNALTRELNKTWDAAQYSRSPLQSEQPEMSPATRRKESNAGRDLPASMQNTHRLADITTATTRNPSVCQPLQTQRLVQLNLSQGIMPRTIPYPPSARFIQFFA